MHLYKFHSPLTGGVYVSALFLLSSFPALLLLQLNYLFQIYKWAFVPIKTIQFITSLKVQIGDVMECSAGVEVSAIKKK